MRTRTIHGQSAPKCSNGHFWRFSKCCKQRFYVGRGGGDRIHYFIGNKGVLRRSLAF